MATARYPSGNVELSCSGGLARYRSSHADLESRADGITASLKQGEATALAAIAEIGLDAEEAQNRIRATATPSVRSRRFGPTFEGIDIDAARRGLNGLKGAMR
jgi:hypothetical protein